MDELIIDAPQAPDQRTLGEAGGAPVRAIGPLLQAPPDPDLAAVVVVPVRNEAEHLPHLIEALAGQRPPGGPGGRYETVLLFSECRDGSQGVAAEAARRFPDLVMHCVDVDHAGPASNVGVARRLLMDAAAARLQRVGRERQGVILTTDADTRVAPNWLAANLAEIQNGADAVGGQVLVQPADLARLEAPLRRRYLLDHAYRRLISHLEGLIDPDPDDPLPRHHQHAGASLAVTAKAYLEAGGMPELATGEDEAFWRALRRSGARCRHSVRVRTVTSGRLDGRIAGGLAGTLKAWSGSRGDALVEGPEAILDRLRLRARLRALHRAEPLNLQDLRAVAADVGTEPRWLARHLARGRPFFRLQDTVERIAPVRSAPVPLEDAVAGLRDLVLRHAERRRSSRSSR